MKGIYLLLGSNLGDSKSMLRTSIKLLESAGISIIAQSFIYETAAWGKEDQQSFLNQVIQISTNYSSTDLLKTILSVEKEMGRIRKEKWGERLIDIDILYFNDFVLNKNDLVLPHPEIQNRRFALVPMVELAPGFVHPVLLKDQKTLLKECADELEVVLFDFTGINDRHS